MNSMFQSQYIEKLLNVSQFFSIFSNLFGQKGRLNYTILIINKKNLTWDLIFAYFGQFSAI